MNSPYPIVFNAEIESADIRFDRGVFLSCWVFLKWGGGTVQGFGGYVLGGDPFSDAKCADHSGEGNFAAEFIGGVMSVAGVENFADMKGKIVRVGKNDDFGEILALGHPVKDRWFDAKKRMTALAGGDA